MNRLVLHGGLLSVMFMWGLVFVGVAKLLREVDSVQLVTIRFIMISLAFVAMFVVAPSLRPRIDRSQAWLLLAAGVLAVPGSQLAVVHGQNYLSPPLVSALVTTSPAWTALLAWLFLDERFVSRQALGFGVALAGAAIVVLGGTGDTEFTVDNPWGAALILTSPLCWAGFTVLSKPLSAQLHPLTAIGAAMIVGTLSMAPLYPHAAEGLGDLSAAGWWWLVYLVFGGTVVPYLVYFRSLTMLDATQTATYMFVVPFAALLWSWLFLDIVPAAVGLIGGLVIFIGVAVTQFGARRERAVAEIPLFDS